MNVELLKRELHERNDLKVHIGPSWVVSIDFTKLIASLEEALKRVNIDHIEVVAMSDCLHHDKDKCTIRFKTRETSQASIVIVPRQGDNVVDFRGVSL